MINDLGIIVNNNLYTKYENVILDIVSKNLYNQVVVFSTERIDIKNKFIPILPLIQAKFFEGNILVFNTESIVICKNFINIIDIYLYTNDVLWINTPQINYFTLKNIYENINNLKIITSSEEIKTIYKSVWNKECIFINGELNYDKISSILQ
jgi:hypothetical protein